MAGKNTTQAFPLDFNASGWTLEEVAFNVFAGSSQFCGKVPPGKMAEWIVMTLSGEKLPATVCILGRASSLKSLYSFFNFFRTDWQSHLVLPPIVWSGLAFNFWLKYGGYNRQFQQQFADWIKASGNCAVGIIAISLRGKKVITTRIEEIDLTVFLFESQYLKRLVIRPKDFVAIGRKNSVGATVLKNKEAKIKAMLGPGSVGCAKKIVEDAVQSRTIANLSPQRDQKSGRYQYTGRHEDLCRQIFKVYKNEMQYKQSTIDRALRDFVACKRNWD